MPAGRPFESAESTDRLVSLACRAGPEKPVTYTAAPSADRPGVGVQPGQFQGVALVALYALWPGHMKKRVTLLEQPS